MATLLSGGEVHARVPLSRIQKAYADGRYQEVVELCRQAVREPRGGHEIPVIRDLLDDASYRLARLANTRDGYRGYRSAHSRGRYVQDVLERECDLWLADADLEGTDEALADWLRECDPTSLAPRVREVLAARQRARMAGRDTDGDGLSDADDRCVDRSETWNAWEDRDGCPDSLPQDLSALLGVQEEVQFGVDSDRFLDGSAERIAVVVEGMKRHPLVNVEVQGHASAEGDPAQNLDLSRRRAAAVARMMGDLGVAPDRIHPVGYGSSRPRASNATEEGRSLNRRVEIRPWVDLAGL